MTHLKLKFVAAGVLLLMLVPALAACGSSSSTAAAKKIKVGLVTDTGGLNDKSFNHLAFLGLSKAKTDLGIQGDVVESHSESDYVPNLTHFASLNMFHVWPGWCDHGSATCPRNQTNRAVNATRAAESGSNRRSWNRRRAPRRTAAEVTPSDAQRTQPVNGRA